MAKLNTHVAVQDENLRTHVFGPDDELPEWAVEKITNPHVWEVEPASAETFAVVELPDGTVIGDGETIATLPAATEPVLQAGEAAAVPAQESVIDDAALATGETVESVETGETGETGETVAESAALPIPPKGGPNATGAAWAAYAVQEIAARGLQIEIGEDAGRNDIIDALNGAGIPTE